MLGSLRLDHVRLRGLHEGDQLAALGLGDLESVASRCLRNTAQWASLMRIPLCEVFMSRPL
jgi:hypothetical protein